ncbi:MAG: dihydrofolate reductase family protein [Gemmatimonadaceae bacterium]
MAASLDGFIARKDGSVDWLETSDEFAGGKTMDPGFVEAFLETIDCYVMGARTYETASRFEAKGLGWSYGAAECLRLRLADEIRYSILPILIGDGIPFFQKLDGDIALHLAEIDAYESGMVELRYEVRG